jgi:hypothetical protein
MGNPPSAHKTGARGASAIEQEHERRIGASNQKRLRGTRTGPIGGSADRRIG